MSKDSSTKYYQNKKNTIKYYKMRKPTCYIYVKLLFKRK